MAIEQIATRNADGSFTNLFPLEVNKGGTGATWGKQACQNIGAVHTENNLPMVVVRGMTVVALNPDKTQNILSFKRLTELCGFPVARYNCALVGTTSDYAACPTVYGSYCSTDSIGIKCQDGHQVRVNYVILCWRA